MTLIISLYTLFAQKEYNNWYFGFRASITFNTPTGLPKAVDNAMDISQMYACEGSSSISNKNGNLLFYTDGDTIYPKITNGNGLKECWETRYGTQAALIIKKPGNEDLYYIFTTQSWYCGNIKFRYSVSDRKKVSPRNVLLKDNGVEGLCGVRHKNKRDYWIIQHDYDSNKYYSYLLSDSGVANEPVISYVDKRNDNYSKAFHCKASIDGSLIATVVDGYEILICDFDNSTGLLSFKKKIDLRKYFSNPISSYQGYNLYQIELSPNNKYLYFTRGYLNSDNNVVHEVYQFDIDNSVLNIIFTIININEVYGDLQIAPNYKIYLVETNTNHLNVINNPNVFGAGCEFERNAVDLLNGICKLGLPNCVAGLLIPETKLSTSNPVCEGDSITITAKITAPTPICTPLWTGPNGYSSNEKNPRIYNAKPEMTGWYKLSIVEINEEFYIDSIFVEVVEQPKVTLDFKNPVYRCHGEPIELKVNCSDPDVQYLWSTGETTNTIVVSQDGTYTLTATNSNNCDTIIEIQVFTDSLKAEIKAEPSVICTGSQSLLNAHPDSCSYQWSTGDTTQSITVSAAGDYWVEVRDANGCIACDTVQLLEYPAFSVTVSASDTKPCLGDTVVLTADRGIAFKWNTGDTTSSINITQSGAYSVAATDENGCLASDSIEITFGGLVEPPKINIEGSIPPCVGDTLRLRCNANAQLHWSTGDNTAEIYVTQSGIYSVTATTDDGCIYSDSNDVVFVGIQQVEIVGDSSVCQGKSVELTTNVEYNSYLWSTGETTRAITVNNAGTYGIIAENEYGCKTYDTIEVKSYFNQYDIMLNTSFDTVCVGESSIRTVTFSNEGADDIQIDTIYFANPVEFQLVTAINYPYLINHGSNQAIDIKYTANALGETTTTMTIEIEPCNEITNVELSGYGKSTLSLRLPDTVGTIGTNIDIPLYAKSGCGESDIPNLDYDVEIIFGKRLLYPEITNNLVDNRIDGENRVLHYVFSGKDIMPYETQASTISGLLLTSEKTHYDLLIGEVNVNNPFIEVEKTDGSINLNRVCANTMKLLEISAPLDIKYEENEYNIISVIIKTEDVGTHSVELYSIDGKRVFYSAFDKSSESLEEHEIRIDLEQYAMGVYLLRVAAPSGTSSRTIGLTD